MIWHDHSQYRDKHAFLSMSSPAWMNYTKEKLAERYVNRFSQEIGTIAHNCAQDLIDKNVSLAKTDKKILLFELLRNGIPRYAIDIDFLWPNFMAYVNDAIGYRMDTEITLWYDQKCFGRADAIRYDKGMLRIHDYKSGVTHAAIEQLLGYAALFCLEYKDELGLDINKMQFELRLYQYDASVICNPTPQDIREVADKIVQGVAVLNKCDV